MTYSVTVAATVFVHMDVEHKTIVAGVLEQDEGRAMIVFRSEVEANRYRAEMGNYPESEGWKAVSLEPKDLRGFLEMHECPRIAFPEPWTEDGGRVYFYPAEEFTDCWKPPRCS